MAKMVQQHRYYGKQSNKNHNATYASLTDGSAFKKKILALSIQTIPGIKFYINGDNNPIWMGPTGIYEIDYLDNCEIRSLRFEEESLVKLIDGSGNYLIIDILYES